VTESRSRAFRAWIPALVWAATIFVLSSLPGSAYPKTDVVGADKIVHFGLYGILSALSVRGLARATGLKTLALIAAGAALATLYGMTDEFHQRFVPGRNSDWADVLADGIGALLGASVTVAVLRRRRPPPVR
jgi:VanZ family protein